MTHRRILVACAATLLTAGCTVGPNYTRPDVSAPPVYRSAGAAPEATNSTYGDLAWSSVFPDPELQALIRTALAQNYDVPVAASRIAQAQSQLVIARSQQSHRRRQRHRAICRLLGIRPAFHLSSP